MVLLVVIALADLVNTLVTTSTSYARGWPTRIMFLLLILFMAMISATLRSKRLAISESVSPLATT